MKEDIYKEWERDNVIMKVDFCYLFNNVEIKRGLMIL